MYQSVRNNDHNKHNRTSKEGYISNKAKFFSSKWLDSTHGSIHFVFELDEIGTQLCIHIYIYISYPATTLTINDAAPMSSPRASDPKSDCMALNVENKSGLPLPKARKVTPVYSML